VPVPAALPVSPGPVEGRRLRLVVAYLGTSFRGFALQPGQVTVAGTLVAALQQTLRHPVQLTCAGRTDAGVHAWGQVVSFDAPPGADLERLQRSLNKMLAPDITVREVAWAAPGFDARRWATARRYRYSLLCSPWPDPFSAATSWHVGQPLDLRAMQAASDVLLGQHDFGSFCHAVRGRPGPLVRRVLEAEWSEPGEHRLAFEIEASSFCHQMVRSVMGLLVEVGRGRRKAGEMMAVLAAVDRVAAGPIAPPHGLCLLEVRYSPPPTGP
jgi:tRNA pseudouridine38-40 synthase